MRWKIIISAPYMQPIVDRFRSLFADEALKVVVPPVQERMEEAQLLPIIGDIDGIICGDDRLTRRVLEHAKRLKVISKWGTGIDSIDQDAANDLGIRVCRTPNAFSIPVADSVFAYMLSFARHTHQMDRAMKSGMWQKIPGVSLSESTLGIIGVGNIGSEIARRARAFGMAILGTDPKHPSKDLLDQTGIRMVSRQELLRNSDFVTVNCDLNPTSFHLMNDDAFALMKPTACLINTARGPIVEEPALIRALKSKRIAGAGLDVFEHEPLPQGSPLLRMENVLLAPHNSNSSPAAWEKVHQNTIRNLLAGLREVQR